jgi:DNA-binding IclR family transcriptional regulator
MRRLKFTNTQIASIQPARDINRGVVLNLIRRRQPISRADLARVSGLQHSTVSQITEQLIRERWVVRLAQDGLSKYGRFTYLISRISGTVSAVSNVMEIDEPFRTLLTRAGLRQAMQVPPLCRTLG